MYNYTSLLDENYSTQQEDVFISHTQKQALPDILSQNEVFEIDRGVLSAILEYINGWDVLGESKVALSYQTVSVNPGDPVESDFRSAEKPAIQMGFDAMNPDWFSLDIVFRSHLEPELKLLWGYLQRFRNNCTSVPEKDNIFFLNIIAKDTISGAANGEEDKVLSINIMNPIVFYLVPEDTIRTEANVIRMLIPVNLVQFTYEVNDLFESEKDDVVSALESEHYLNLGGGNDYE